MLVETADLLPSIDIQIPRPALPGPYWSDENIETVKRLWGEGLSASQVAAQMGISRNAVIGKIGRLREHRPEHKSRNAWSDEASAKLQQMWDRHSISEIMAVVPYSRSAIIGKAARLGLPPRASMKPPPRPALVRRSSQVKARPVGITCADFDAAIPRDRIKPLVELQANDCRWPIGDPGKHGFGFCCAPSDGASPYCPEHRAFSIEKRGRVTTWADRPGTPAFGRTFRG